MSLLRDYLKFSSHGYIDIFIEGYFNTHCSSDFLKEPLHFRILIGGIIGVLAVCIVIYPSLHDIHGFQDIKGIMIAVLGTILTALGDASSARNAKKQVNPIYANVLGFAAGAFFYGQSCSLKGKLLVCLHPFHIYLLCFI